MNYRVQLRCWWTIIPQDFIVDVEAGDETEAVYRAMQELIGPPGSSYFSPPRFSVIDVEKIQ